MPWFKGYWEGILTRITTAAVRALQDNYPEMRCSFTGDSDTAPRRAELLRIINAADANYLYAGLLYHGGPVGQDQKKHWYDIYPEDKYHDAMAGGSGYGSARGRLRLQTVTYSQDQRIADEGWLIDGRGITFRGFCIGGC